ncbi:MAG: hypothetical protein ABIH52_02780 [Candidatus Aenigmatarchaeota archaeon]
MKRYNVYTHEPDIVNRTNYVSFLYNGDPFLVTVKGELLAEDRDHIFVQTKHDLRGYEKRRIVFGKVQL